MRRFFAAESEYDPGPEITRAEWGARFRDGAPAWCEDEDGTLIFSCVLADGRRFTRVRPVQGHNIVYKHPLKGRAAD